MDNAKEQLQRDLNTMGEELIATLKRFENNEQFNTMREDGGWSGGMVAEHIRMSAGSMADALHGSTKDADRQADEHVPMLKKVFLDFETKMQSPPFVVPKEQEYDRDEMLKVMEGIIAKLKNGLATLDMNKICTDFEVPKMGNLSRAELIAFATYHSMRHTHQMKNLL